MPETHITQTSTKKFYRSLLNEIPFWQGMGFILMICLIWAAYFFNLTEFFFGEETGRAEWFGLSLITAIIIVMGFVIVAHSYTQQQRVLKGIIRVCSHCHKVRIQETDWINLEYYVSDHTLANFSHGICPDCYQQAMQEIDGTKTARQREMEGAPSKEESDTEDSNQAPTQNDKGKSHQENH